MFELKRRCWGETLALNAKGDSPFSEWTSAEPRTFSERRFSAEIWFGSGSRALGGITGSEPPAAWSACWCHLGGVEPTAHECYVCLFVCAVLFCCCTECVHVCPFVCGMLWKLQRQTDWASFGPSLNLTCSQPYCCQYGHIYLYMVGFIFRP